MIKVVRGNPTPEELAAALAVVRARTATAAASGTSAPGDALGDAPALPGQWSDPGRIARSTRHLPGPRAWARTYWPG
ncbi:acyl-CoA carboxylase epsilon subunit [Streptomyces sp. NPDC058195]|uniref:acyl-CoA carboxylase epsilon subunit n=1 Tax=Streptomyces sp. NPDC058195 TaxID=3346375 RepID=UPI0036EE515A